MDRYQGNMNPTLSSDAAPGEQSSCYILQSFSQVDGYWVDVDAYELTPVGLATARTRLPNFLMARIIKRTEEMVE